MKNGNQLIVATAVVGGLLAGAPDALAQTTYTNTSTTITNGTVTTATTVGAGSTATISNATVSAPITVTSGGTVAVPAGSAITGTSTITASGAGSAVTVGAGSTVSTPLAATSGATVTVGANSTVTGTLTASSGSTVTVGAGSTIASATVGGGSTLAVSGVTVASGGAVQTGTASSPGTVTVSGASGLTISSGATLAGAGTITGSNGATVQIAGLLKPGNSPGILTVQNAPLTLTSGSTLGIDIDGTTAGNGAGYSSQVKGTGTTTLAANGLLTPNLGSAVSYSAGEAGSTGYRNPAIGTGYTIVTTEAANGVTGAFTGLGTTNGARSLSGGTSAALLSNTTFDVVYNANSIVLYVTPSKYQNLAQSGVSLSTNQTNAATALQDLRTSNKSLGVERIANADLKSLFDNLAPQSAGNLQTIYDQIGGGSIATLGNQAVQTSNLVTDAFTSRASHERTLAQTGLAGGSKLGLAGGDVDGKNLGDRGWAAWVQPIGQIGDIDSDGNGPGYSHSTIGGLAGLEGRFRNTVVGFGYGYARDSLDFNDFNNKTDIDNHIINVYGEQSFGRAFVNGTVGYTFKNVDETRNIAIGGYNKTATGKVDGSDINAAANVGYTFTPASYVIEPTVGLRYNAFHLDAFTESGADSLNLHVNEQNYDSLQSVLAVRIARPFTLSNGLKLVPEVRAGWQHELLGNRSSIVSNFTSSGSAFTTTGSQLGDDTALIGVGLKAQLTGTLDVFTDYNGRIGGKQSDHGLTAGLKYKF